MRITICGVFCLAFLLAGSCSSGSGDGARPDRSAKIPLSCFEEVGDPVCHINGVPVPKASWDLYRRFYRKRNPVWTDLQVSLNTLEKILIPRCVAYEMASDRIDELSRKAWEAYDRVIAKEPFADVVRAYSTDEAYRKQGGVLGTFKPGAKELGSLGACFLHHMWNQPVLVPTQPFVEYHGIFILLVTAEKKGALAEEHERTVKAVYLPFFAGADSDRSHALRSALAKARVGRIQDPDLDRMLPAVYREER